jgi:hypothetical protein
MQAYEVYSVDGKKEHHLLGILPERRRNPSRITEKSVINWIRMFFGDIADRPGIFIEEITLHVMENAGNLISIKNSSRLS